jgi:hypothetical protein
LRPLQLLHRVRQRGFRRCELRLALLDGGFEGIALDLENQLSLLDRVAVLEFPRPEKALNASAKVGFLQRLHAADEFLLRGQHAQGSRLDQDGGWRRSLRRGRNGADHGEAGTGPQQQPHGAGLAARVENLNRTLMRGHVRSP